MMIPRVAADGLAEFCDVYCDEGYFTADEARRIFRKAGVYLAKGNVARALEVLKEGRDLAQSEGHAKMARLFEAEMERAKAPVDPEKE